jgi:multidrug resistance protein
MSPGFVITMTLFIDMTGFGMIIPLLPFYAATFQAGSTAIGILVASFAIMQFIFSPILGRISDNVGRRPVLLLSILISIVSLILFTLADSFLILLLSRIIGGIATESGVAQAYIADTTEEKDRAKGLGKLGAALGVGFIVGPALGGLLSVYGFWAPGLAAVALTTLNLLFVYMFLPEPIKRKQSFKQNTPESNVTYMQKLRVALTKPFIGPTLLIYFIITLAFSAIPVIVPLLTIAFFNFGSLQMSYVFMYIGIIQVILQGFLIGRLVHRVGEEALLAFGPLLMAVGMLLMPLIQNIAIFLTSITMLSLGIGIIDTIVPSFISERTPIDEQGGMLGITHSASSIARVPGPLIGGSVFELGGLVASFFLGGALLLIAFGVACRVFQACRRIPDYLRFRATVHS